MGYYIDTPLHKGKADWLIENHGAVETVIPGFHFGHDDDIVICVVDNGPFEAAGIACDLRELQRFMWDEDPRPKRWLVMAKTKVIALCPKVKEVLK